MTPAPLQLDRHKLSAFGFRRDSAASDPQLYSAPSNFYYSDYVVEQPTCLTTLPHDGKSVKDHLTHYMGCIKMSQRKDFFLDEELWGTFQDDTDSKLLERKYLVAVSIAAQLKRIQVVRKAISKEKPKIVSGAVTRHRHPAKTSRGLFSPSRLDSLNTDPDDAKSTSLVEDVENSHMAWKSQRAYQTGIAEVRRWRQERDARLGRQEAKLSADFCPPRQAQHPHYRDLEDLVKFINENNNSLENDEPDGGDAGAAEDGSSGSQPGDDGIAAYDLEKDVNAYIIAFKSEPGSGLQPHNLGHEVNDKIKERFPDQRVALKYILNDDRILKKDRDENEVRYLHVPANNMHWIEEIIGQYYDRERPDLDSPYGMSSSSVASMLLRPQYWRGQQHVGGDNRVHARHLRPICERVSARNDTAEDVPKNMVLFMPYLHWETDRKREAIAHMIDEEAEAHREKQKRAKETESDLRKRERQGLRSEAGHHPGSIVVLDRATALPNFVVQNVKQAGYHAPLSLEHATLGMLGKKRHPLFRINKYGRVIVDSPLAQFLLDAARLYESMSTYRDQRMISTYLFGTAPLHPRRTLDQSHFWTLRSTRTRDRDQVVYRGTRANPKNTHRLLPWKRKTQDTESQRATKPKSLWRARQERPPEPDEDIVYSWSCPEHGAGNGPQPALYEAEDKKPAQRETASLLRSLSTRARSAGPAPAIHLPEAPNTEDITDPGHMDGGHGSLYGRGSAENGKNVEPSYESQRSGSMASALPDEGKAGKHVTCDHCREDIRKVSRVVMVDQLWMWVLDEKTIITSFPRRYGVNKIDNSGVHRSIRNRLKSESARNNRFRSAFDIALVILDECSNTFFDRTKTSENIPQVMDIFSEAIGNVTNKQTTSFERVWHWTDMASELYRSIPSSINVNDVQISLLDIKHEGKVQREIKDIIEELDIMLHINRKQQEIIKRFTKHAEDILSPFLAVEDKLLSPPAGEDKRGVPSSGANSPMGLPKPYFDSMTAESPYSSQMRAFFSEIRKEKLRERLTREELSDIRERELVQNWFIASASELNADVDDRIQELQLLKTSAESTAQSVNDLLGLKQQQAGVVQAWYGVQQAEETVSQGRAIMVFTLITLVFLPLSFMSSVFGMNNSNFGGNTWTLYEQFKLMFPISFSLVIIVFFVAFSEIVRALLWSIWKLVYNIVVIWTRVYYFWLSVRDDWSSKSLTRRVELHVRQLRAEVRQQRSVFLRQQAVKEHEKRSKEQERQMEEKKRKNGEV